MNYYFYANNNSIPALINSGNDIISINKIIPNRRNGMNNIIKVCANEYLYIIDIDKNIVRINHIINNKYKNSA